MHREGAESTWRGGSTFKLGVGQQETGMYNFKKLPHNSNAPLNPAFLPIVTTTQ